MRTTAKMRKSQTRYDDAGMFCLVFVWGCVFFFLFYRNAVEFLNQVALEVLLCFSKK